jgi:hypothetical protein
MALHTSGAPRKKQKPWHVSAPPAHAVPEGALPSVPRLLDVVEFAAARVAEIRALTDTLQSAGAGGHKRAFQLLPRHMRRRTMSHNPRRIPRRLRAAALREVRVSYGRMM